jgi:hypothetical protein
MTQRRQRVAEALDLTVVTAVALSPAWLIAGWAAGLW